MKKSVAGQKIGAQMVSATDGSAFTGSVTVSVTGDAGTQATGSVGSGACTHEGNGYHTYAPAQAETNYDLVAFTFTGTGAIPTTVQVFTSFPQTGDSFALIGATGSGLTSLASAATLATVAGYVDTEVASILAAVDTEVAAIKAVTDNLPNSGTLSSLATQASVNTIDDFLDTEIAAIKAVTDALPNAGALTSLATQASVNTLAGYVDTEVAAIKSVTDKLDTAVELDGSVYRFTTNALEQAPTGGGAADGSGFTAIPWNPAWDAEVQSECTDALNAYDPPTRAEATSDANSILAAVDLVDNFVDTEIAAIQTTLGTPAGASLSADVAAVKAQTAAIEVDTGTDLPATLATIAGYVDTEVASVLAAVDTEVAAIKNKTDSLTFTTANRVDATAVTVSDKTGYTASTIGAGAISASSFGASAIDAAALATDAVNEIADGLLGRNVSGGSSAGRTVKQALATLRNKWTVIAGTLTVYDTDDTTVLFTAAITTTAGNPVTASDPA